MRELTYKACLSAHGWVDLGTYPGILVYIEALIGFNHIFSLVGLLPHVTLSRLHPWRALTGGLEGRMYTSRTGKGLKSRWLPWSSSEVTWWSCPSDDLLQQPCGPRVWKGFLPKEKNQVDIATRGKNKRRYPGTTNDICCLTRFECKECLESESEVAQSTLCDPVDCSLPGSSVHGILQARILEWVAISFSRGSSHPGMEPWSPALQADVLTSEPPGKPPSALRQCIIPPDCIR